MDSDWWAHFCLDLFSEGDPALTSNLGETRKTLQLVKSVTNAASNKTVTKYSPHIRCERLKQVVNIFVVQVKQLKKTVVY